MVNIVRFFLRVKDMMSSGKKNIDVVNME